MIRTKIFSLSLVALTTVVICGGCVHWFGAKKGNAAAHKDALFAVTAEKAPFYEFGPMQGRGADRELPRDTLVTIIRRSSGYSKVKLSDGKTGFVANDDISKAPERLIAKSSDEDWSNLPPPPPVKLPTSPDIEPTPLPEPLMPQ
jgi:hypothetical protein